MWEIIDSHTERMRVPGGWIVRSLYREYYSGTAVSVHQIFIKDESHAWEINNS